jgi:hypothetical protein
LNVNCWYELKKSFSLLEIYGGTLRDEPLLKKVSAVLALASEFDSIIEAIGDDPAPSTAPAWHDAPTVPGVVGVSPIYH